MKKPLNLMTLIDYSLLSMANSLDVLMPLIYPDIFPEPLTDEQVQEILER